MKRQASIPIDKPEVMSKRLAILENNEHNIQIIKNIPMDMANIVHLE